MAGIRQHYVPRFLQRGFAAKRNGRDAWVYAFRPEGEPALTNVDDLFVLPRFYDDASGAGVDSRLTVAERVHAKITETIRQTRTLDRVDRRELGRLVAFFASRTRHMRTSFGDVATRGLVGMREGMSSGAFRDLVLAEFDRDPQAWARRWLTKDVDPRIAVFVEAAMGVPELRNMVRIKLHELLPQLPARLEAAFGQLFSGGLDKALREGQGRAIDRFASGEDAVKFADLAWDVWTTPPGEEFILGDAVVVARMGVDAYGSPWKPSREARLTIVVPLSGRVALRGARGELFDGWSVARVNVESAAASREGFIAARLVNDWRSLQAQIGTRCELLSEAELRAAVQDAFASTFSLTDVDHHDGTPRDGAEGVP